MEQLTKGPIQPMRLGPDSRFTFRCHKDVKCFTQCFHVEATAAQHFPIAGGLAGMGATGFWYEQLGPDTGDGATLGDFKARSVGFGPVASYVHKVYGHDLLAELKWLHEVDTKRRLEGDTIFLKVIFKFW